MVNFCPKCGTERNETANFCRKCGYDFRQRTTLIRQESIPLSSFEPMRKLSAVVTNQHEWLRRNTLLEPVQELLDNIKLRTVMEQATDLQKDQVLAGYQIYTQEQIERVIDQVRHARRLDEAETSLEIKRRELEIEDVIAEREHQRGLERLREEQRHEKEMMELRAQLELVNAIIQSFNQLKMIQLEAQAEGLADVQQMKLLGQVIRQSFAALAEIDVSQLQYARRIEKLKFENLEEAPSYQLIEELVTAITDRLTKGIIQFGERQRSDKKTRRGT